MSFEIEPEPDFKHIQRALSHDPVVSEFPEPTGNTTEPTPGELQQLEEAMPALTDPQFIESAFDYLASVSIEDPLEQYFAQIRHIPLLTRKEEVALSQRVEKGRSGREELAHAKGNVREKRKEELRGLIEDGDAAFELLITSNLKLVVSVAKKYQNRGVEFLDSIQDGNEGLMRGAKKFDWRKGHKFSTYVTWWIRQAVSRGIEDKGRTIRLPAHMGHKISKLLKVQRDLAQTLGREPTVGELAEKTDIPPQNVLFMLDVARRPVSFSAPVDENDDSELGELISDTDEPDIESTAAHREAREKIKEVLMYLNPRKAKILRFRYGLVDGTPYTLEETGRKFNITRERIRQLEKEALEVLRHPDIRRELRGHLDENS